MDRTLEIGSFPEITIFDPSNDFNSEVVLLSQKDDTYHYKFKVESSKGAAISPAPITLRWKLPSLNIKGVWKSGGLHDKRQQYDWELDHLNSRISVDAPLVSVFGHNDMNVISFACSDAINLLQSNALLREEDNHLYCHFTFFAERHPAITNYEADLRFDLRQVLYGEVIRDVSLWWESFDHLKPTPVPDLAFAPLYSTWYQFHQNLDEDIILQECKVANSVGYEFIILDDGWQTMDNNRGYDYTGDWNPDRFPDMATFVKKCQDTGLKFGLWYSVPFCGQHSKAYQKFKGKFLTENHRWAPVFDPRYPEVRSHLIDIYVTALKEWNLDGFKLDFIDDFQVYPETVLTKENGRDYANVNAAVDRLLTDVIVALRAIKPNIAIEFRQKYIGPAMRKFGNMFRAFDCPNDAVSNRIRIADVKMLCGNSAVHSDPQTWHFDEKVELAALQILNGMFAVPQMSVHLRNLPTDHLNMVKFYTKYWKENMDVLMHGKFCAENPLGNYPVLKSTKDQHIIIGMYDKVIVDSQGEHTIDLLNGADSNSVVLRHGKEKASYQLQVWNCMGELLSEDEIVLSEGLVELAVPKAGMVRLNKR